MYKIRVRVCVCVFVTIAVELYINMVWTCRRFCVNNSIHCKNSKGHGTRITPK